MVETINREGDTSSPYFNIGSYNVFLCDNCDDNAIVSKRYDFSIEFNANIDAIDIFTTLQSSETLTMLCDFPLELSDLIQQFENSIRHQQATLFIDTQKRYIVPCKVDFVNTNNIDLIFIAYNVYESEVEMVIKAFSYESLYAAYNAIIDELGKFGLIKSIKFHKHIKALKLDDLKTNSKQDYYCASADKLLEGTLLHPKEYSELFKVLMRKGFIDRVYRDKLEQELTTNSFLKLMSAMNKVLLLPLENNRHQMLHDSVPHNILEDDEKTVYTLNPRVWQYFMNRWFEEYVGKALETIKSDSSFGIDIDYDGGGEYNFHESGNAANTTEIDWIITVRKDTVFKLVFIECKRTLSKKTIKNIKEKWENKLLNTRNYDIADILISLGYFSKEDNLKERCSLTTFSGYHVPLCAFATTEFELLVTQLKEYFRTLIDGESTKIVSSSQSDQNQTA